MSENLAKAFGKLIKDGHDSVDDFMKWIKDSKIIDETKEAEKKAKKLFDKVKDEQHVKLEQFKEVVTKLAAEQKKSVEQLSSMLLETIPILQKALLDAASAVQDALSPKKHI